MAASFLLVPIHLDALYLLQDRTVIEPLADFSRLDGSSIPYLSEVLLSQPFKDRRFLLLAGIHLHWALPDALTHGRRQKNTVNEPIVFPAVPNRWLVTRSRVGGSDQKQWVVESDYLYPPGDDANQLGRVTYPYRVGDGDPTYRYLGRNLPLASWEAGSEGDYLDKLTAVGYGEVTFAAFYPNCHSVFGFHDPELPAVPQRPAL